MESLPTQKRRMDGDEDLYRRFFVLRLMILFMKQGSNAG